jgi:hypothetical protein
VTKHKKQLAGPARFVVIGEGSGNPMPGDQEDAMDVDGFMPLVVNDTPPQPAVVLGGDITMAERDAIYHSSAPHRVANFLMLFQKFQPCVSFTVYIDAGC